MSRVVAVTGATGFVGTHLVHRLVQQNASVRALVRNVEKAKQKLPSSVEWIQGDITDCNAVDTLLKGADECFHLASMLQDASTPDNVFWQVHVEATKQVLDTAVKHSVGRFVHFSTVGVLGSPKVLPANEQSPYATKDIYQITKAEGEKLALKYFKEGKLSGIVIRPAAVYGPGDLRMLKLFKFISQKKFRMIGKGNVYSHPVYVDDLVDGTLQAAAQKQLQGEVYILGGAQPVLLKDWVKIISDQFQIPAKKVSIPYWPVYIAAYLCEIVCKPLGIDPPLYRRRVAFFSKSRAFEIKKAEKDFGYTPKVSLEEGVKRTIKWYKANGYL